jgi:zinc transport system ATP-binding protein
MTTSTRPTVDSSQPAIEVKGVTFSYGGPVVLDDVSLCLLQRDFASLVGPNGGGKSTLLKIILGLLKPARGSVRVLGRTPGEFRRRIGYIPQKAQFDPQFPVSVFEVVLMGRLGWGHPIGFYSKTDREHSERALEEVGLADLRHRAFSALSGGQQQRVLIARALTGEPEILLLDEPTANLDVHMEETFYDLLVNLNQRMTVVLVSHDLGVVSRLVRTVVCVKQKVMVHPTSDLTGEMIRDMYGGEIRMVRHDIECLHEPGHHHGSGH